MFRHPGGTLKFEALSNYFVYSGFASEKTPTGLGLSEQQYVYFRFDGDPTPIETLAELKLWLADRYNSGNPVTVYYVLEFPIETPLTDAELNAYRAIHSNKPNTTIMNDAGAHMIVDYTADTKLYINKAIKEVLS